MTDDGSPTPRRVHPLRTRVHLLLSGGESRDPWARAIDWFLICLIIVSTALVVLESVAEIGGRYPEFFDLFEIFSVAIFTLEYLLRLWAAPEERAYRDPVRGRLRFALGPLPLIDLLAILPFYLGLLTGLDGSDARVLRIFRLFKLARYSNAMTMILNVLRREAEVIGATLAVLGGILVIAASLMYTFEHRAQPEVFTDIPTTFWWAIATLTTVGYGDMVPITLGGRIMGGITAVIGIGLIALPAGVLASGFLDELQRRREAYTDSVEHALADGVISPAERRMLNRLRDQLDLDPEVAARLIERAILARDVVCPHCGNPVLDEGTGLHNHGASGTGKA